VPFDGDASVRLEGVDLAFTVPVVALSHEALLVRAPESAPAGSLVHLELTMGSDLVQGMGEVAGVRPSGGGHELLIQLLFVDEQSRAVLRRLVSESRGEPADVEWATGGTPAGASAQPAPAPAAAAISPEAPSTAEAGAPPRQPAQRPAGERVDPAPNVSEPRPAAVAAPGRTPTPLVTTAPAPAPVSTATSTPAPGRAAEEVAEPASRSAWQLDPIDPTQVAAAELEKARNRPRPAADSSPPYEGSPPAAGKPAAAEAPTWRMEALTASWQEPVAATPAPATVGQAASFAGGPMVEDREPDDLGRDFGRLLEDEAEEDGEELAEQRRSRVRLLPALLLILAFVAAAWWTRDAWLGGSGSSAPTSPESATEGDRAGQVVEGQVVEGQGQAGDAPADVEVVVTGEDELDEPAAPPEDLPAQPVGDLAANTSGPRELLGIDVRELRGETRVTVTLSGPIADSAISSFGLATPPRFVVRLRGVSGAGPYAGGTPELAQTPELSQVRVGLHQGPGGVPETHVVFDLAALGTTGTVSSSGSRLEVRLAR
jgi:hypothetical protein